MWNPRVPKTIGDHDIPPYLLGLFNTLAPHIPDIDWCMDRAHRSLAPKPPTGANPRHMIVLFHYYDSKEAPYRANQARLGYKGDKIQIYSDLSPIT